MWFSLGTAWPGTSKGALHPVVWFVDIFGSSRGNDARRKEAGPRPRSYCVGVVWFGLGVMVFDVGVVWMGGSVLGPVWVRVCLAVCAFVRFPFVFWWGVLRVIDKKTRRRHIHGESVANTEREDQDASCSLCVC